MRSVRRAIAALVLALAPGDAGASPGHPDLALERASLGPGGPVHPGRTRLDGGWQLELEVHGVDAEALRELLPPSWGISRAEGVLDGRLELASRSGRGVAGRVSVEMEKGSVDHLDAHHRAPLRFESDLAFGDGPTRLTDARLASASAGVAGLTASDFRCSFSYGEDVVEVHEAVFGIYGGTTRHRGRIEVAGDPSFELESSADGIDTGQLLGSTDRDAEPTLEGSSKLRGPLPVSDDWLRSVGGRVRLDLAGGSLPGSHIVRSVSRALLHRVPGLGNEVAARPARTPLRHAGATFEVDAGTARTRDLKIVTAEYVVEASGHIDTDLSIDLEGTVALTVLGVDSVLTMVGLGREGLASLPVAPIRATGTLRDPHVETDPASLPVSAWRLVPRSVGAARGVVEKGAGAVLDAARGAGGVLRKVEPGAEAGEGER